MSHAKTATLNSEHHKNAIFDSKLFNYTIGLLIIINGFLLLHFTNNRTATAKNYTRSILAAPSNFVPAKEKNIVSDVEAYMHQQKEKSQAMEKTTNGLIPETIFHIAHIFQERGDQTANIRNKTQNYSLALLELEKLSTKDPHIVRQARPAKQHLRYLLHSISTVGVELGNTREKIELLYGIPDKDESSEQYYPIGSITYLTYDKIGLQFGLRNNNVFSINVRSNFKGIVNGVQIGDENVKIQALYKGEVKTLPGNNFAYQAQQTENRQLTFVFSDNDNLVDGVKMFDNEIYGKWSSILQ